MTEGGEEKNKPSKSAKERRFDKDEADAADDQNGATGKRHDNPNHAGMRSHVKRALTAEDTRDDLEDDE